jgi:hypothetical protein
VIAQMSDAGEIYKLYINTTMDLQTTITIAVEMAGDYEVSIFAIEGERGILDSIVAYRRAVTVTRIMSAMDTTTSFGIGNNLLSPLIM